MVTKTRVHKSAGSKKRFIGKPTGRIQERVQAAGPQHFGVIPVDCAKRRSKWMLCDFYGRVIIEPTPVEHSAGALKAMTQFAAEACKTEGLSTRVARPNRFKLTETCPQPSSPSTPTPKKIAIK